MDPKFVALDATQPSFIAVKRNEEKAICFSSSNLMQISKYCGS